MKTAQQRQIDNKNIMAEIRKGVALVDFDADWCVPCKEQSPIVERLANKYEGKAFVFNLNVDKFPDSAISLGVTSVPTLIVFKNGDEFQRFIGIQSEETLVQSLEAALEMK